MLNLTAKITNQQGETIGYQVTLNGSTYRDTPDKIAEYISHFPVDMRNCKIIKNTPCLKKGTLQTIIESPTSDTYVIPADKYQMPVQCNIDLAKRNIVDSIWKSARLEGVAVTYPDTQAIFDGLAVQGIGVNDIQTINNLKHSWRFILENISHPLSYPLICQINQHVGWNLFHEAGKIRNIPVRIGGTDWIPPIPIESQIKEEIEEIIVSPTSTDRAISLMIYIMRRQMFMDGNKRTALLAANHLLISSGAGIITIPIELQPKFLTLTLDYYKSNNPSEIKRFIYENCIDGILG